MLLISFKNSFDGPLRVDEDFTAVVHQLNLARAQGHGFVVMDDENGEHMVINATEIVTIKQEEVGTLAV